MSALTPNRGGQGGAGRGGVSMSADAARALAASLREGQIGAFKAESDVAACLMPLLQALNWRGTSRRIVEAMPHFANDLTLADLRNTLAELGYRTVARPLRQAGAIDPRVLPAFLMTEDGRPYVLYSRRADGGFDVFDGRARGEAVLAEAEITGTLFLVATTERRSEQRRERQDNWVGQMFRRFNPLTRRLFAMTFVLNLMALVVPLFILTVYDRVIPAQSTDLLIPLGLGVLGVFAFEAGFRYVRSRMLALVAGRLEQIIATSVFRKILALPSSLTESAPLGAQVARMREFDSLRDLFTGTVVTVLLELPFALLFIAVIALLGGWIALVPVAMMLVFAVVGLLLLPALRRRVAATGRARAERHAFLVETVSNLRTVREAGVEGIWADRFRDLNAEALLSQFKSSQIHMTLQTVAQGIMMAAGVLTIAVGVVQVLGGVMTIGALIATMALVWRVLSPIQNLFLTLMRAEQAQNAVRQINQLMRMPEEERRGTGSTIERRWAGRVALNRVSFRYTQTSEPAIFGLNLVVEPGQMLAITGTNGSGKSTLLRLILGLYRPQAGQVTLDGLDIRQLDPGEVRRTIAYVPQETHMFYGTIAQNLRMANPVAGDDEIRRALDLAGLWHEVQQLPQGLDTRFGDQSFHQLNAGFRQRLSLARGFLRDAPVLLLDEPAQALDEAGDRALCAALERLKGSRTIIMVSYRPSHIRMADAVLVLDSGVPALYGAPDDVLAKLPKGLL
ncbi:hypothetical protein CCR85_12215 [Rhodothalassium salexigens]|uniref:peptidase domain-containing ABC transporter n=1 Tax=Rhodothalassium salexigens TaxID=1086 RepID=UPI001912E787|nr:peptidase domain-containing ABC transporter [Rhodothalassium salexigens]MBK5912254.1 hypothetical protein [Rhodothalassium salexigens]MBK5921425.1 hypothetical protein [Rhodothalassium salexigens]